MQPFSLGQHLARADMIKNNKTKSHMSNNHTSPKENGAFHYIKCSKYGVICLDKKGFDLFCEMLYGDRNPGKYEALRTRIKGIIREYRLEVDVKEIIGHLCEMASRMATSKEGWYVDNHISYLTTVAKNRVGKLKKNRTSHSNKVIDLRGEFMASGDAFKSYEEREIIEKSLRILMKLSTRDFLFIEGMKIGHYENDALARYLNMENDAKFRKAKQRAMERMKKVVLDVMGRRPDGFGMAPDIHASYSIPAMPNRPYALGLYSHNDDNHGFSFPYHSNMHANSVYMHATTPYDLLESSAGGSVNARDAHSILLTFIVQMDDKPKEAEPLNAHGFRTHTECLRGAA